MHNLQSIIMCNSIGVILCAFILLNSAKTRAPSIIGDKLFLLIVWEVLIMCIVEPLSYVADGVATPFGIFLNRFSNTILYMLDPIPPATWFMYVIVKLFGFTEKTIKKFLPFTIPALILSILGLFNIFFDIFFKISSPDNVYSRITVTGTIDFGICLFYMLSAVALTLIFKKTLVNDIFFPVMLFVVLPTVGTLIQVLFYGISTMWVSSAVASVIVYIYMQSETASIDMLTGLYNRSRLEIYIRKKCSRKNPDLHGIMLDIDKFKAINDTLGHAAGDDALTNFGFIISKTVDKQGFPARFAGDEFIVILENTDDEGVNIFINKLRVNMEAFNNTAKKRYRLVFSYGYTSFGCVNDDTPDKFFKRMDIEMYRNKNRK